jgi:inactivated superfamily I helicase
MRNNLMKLLDRIHLGIGLQSWLRTGLLVLVLALVMSPASAAEKQAAKQGGSETFQSLDKKIQNVKQEVLDLNRDLFVLEEELLFPASTQVAVFLSVDVGEFFQLDSVQLKLDDKMVTNYLYTERENAALLRGGVQRLYMGNLRTGKHELVAVFTGKGTHERDYKRGATLVFEKQTDPKYIELKIRDLQKKLQPEFEVKESK